MDTTVYLYWNTGQDETRWAGAQLPHRVEILIHVFWVMGRMVSATNGHAQSRG